MSTKLVCDCCYETMSAEVVGQHMFVKRGSVTGAVAHYDICLKCWNKAAEVLHLPMQEVQS